MSKSLSMFVLGALLVVGALFQSSMAQTTYIVGDSEGWRIPPWGPSTYEAWASRHTFVVGDVLEFNLYGVNTDVAEVTKAAYDGCNTSTPTSHVIALPARVDLTSTGDHYFISTFPDNCDLGQKLAVNVVAASTTTPPSGTTSLSGMALPFVFLSISLALFH